MHEKVVDLFAKQLITVVLNAANSNSRSEIRVVFIINLL